jgi:hypothetical protein
MPEPVEPVVQLDAHHVFCVLLAELPFDPQPRDLIRSCPGNRSDQRGIHADFALSYAPPRLVHPENFKAGDYRVASQGAWNTCGMAKTGSRGTARDREYRRASQGGRLGRHPASLLAVFVVDSNDNPLTTLDQK